MIFVPWTFVMKNNDISTNLLLFVRFLYLWQIPLLFFISGAASFSSLEKRTRSRYLMDRVRRLVVPLLFGILIVVPPQVYAERVLGGQFRGTFFEFYPHFFRGFYPRGNFSYHHLWFLAYLFIFSGILILIFRYLKRDILNKWLRRVSHNWWAVLLFLIPFYIVEAILRPHFPETLGLVGDWAALTFYFLCFLYGYIIYAVDGFLTSVEQNPFLFILLGLFAYCTITLLAPAAIVPLSSHTPAFISYRLLGATATWFLLLGLVGAGRRYLRIDNRFIRYATEAVLPFYILHQTVIVLAAFYVVRFPFGIFLKFIMISVPSIILTLFIYEVFVRRTAPTRFIFGMRPKKKESPTKKMAPGGANQLC
jgi:hypothetical protein